MKIITVTNQKGGVGKTTTAHALSTGLHSRGFKTLIIDLDPQSNITYVMGVEQPEYTIYDLFNGESEPQKAVKSTDQGDIIPGSLFLAGADMEYTKPGREYILKEITEKLEHDYNYIIIDTPPALGILTTNALTASNSLIIPMGADIFSLQGLGQLKGLIDNVRKYCNKNLEIEGLLITKYNNRTVLNRELKEVMEDAATKLNTKVFNTVIREGVAIRESQALQTNIFENSPKANVTLDYNSFIDELLGV
jgi:chromosome partitioning protein